MRKNMKPYLIRLFIAVWFVGMVAFAVWGLPVYSEGAQAKYLPLMVQNIPVWGGPALHSYLTVGNVAIGNDSELFSLRADGSDFQLLTDNDIYDHEALLSPDGGRILSEQSSQEEDYSRLVLMNRDGSNPRTLMEVPYLSIVSKAWSPDGRWISVLIDDFNPTYRPVFVIAADTSIPVELTSFGDSVNSPVWSPDSRYLAFQVADFPRDPTPQLWVAPMDGRAPYALTAEPMPVRRMVWSPLSDAIFYTTEDDDLTRRVVLDGSENRPVLSPPYRFEKVLSGGQRLLAYDDADNLVIVTIADNTIMPVTTSASGLDSYSVSPNESYLISKGRYDDHIILHPLDGGTDTTISCGSDRCYVSNASWADDETRLLLNFADGLGYVNINESTPVIQPIAIWERAPAHYGYLPSSSRYASAFRAYGYPPPPPQPAIYSINTDTRTAFPIVPFNYVEPTTWYYLP